MNLMEDLRWRDLIYATTDPELDEVLNNEKITFYFGADPTGDSLHVGHLVGYLAARRLELAGHEPILLIGGATGLIGDPKGSGERKMLTLEKSLENAEGITAQVKKLMNVKVVNNYDWTHNLDVITFLRDYGKNFNVNYLLGKETVKARLETGISYTEFSYQILQALDFEHLFREENCRMQIGGQDQWGNITSGVELIRKRNGADAKVYGLTFPLVTKSDGTKFGKSESGAVWLDPKKTSPYEFYQFWINTADQDVLKRLKQFTFLSKEEIENIMKNFMEHPEERLAQKVLAKEVTTLVHGEKAFEEALQLTEALFTGNVGNLTVEEIEMGFKDVKNVYTETDILLVDALVSLELASSKRESREFIKSGAVAINGVKVTDLELMLTKELTIGGKFTVIRRGKKKYALLKR